jgi:hypothetical protein
MRSFQLGLCRIKESRRFVLPRTSCCGLFNDAVNISDYIIALNVRIISEMGRIWDEVVVA